MISKDIVRNLLTLSGISPFDAFTRNELLLVASHVRPRSFAPGETMMAGGAVADRLIVVTKGEAKLGSQRAPQLFDAASALFGLPVAGDYVAGEDGVEALCLAKPHLFTIARDCPDFVLGLAADAGGDAK